MVAPELLQVRYLEVAEMVLASIHSVVFAHCGSFHLSSPTGGLAYGMERNIW